MLKTLSKSKKMQPGFLTVMKTSIRRFSVYESIFHPISPLRFPCPAEREKGVEHAISFQSTFRVSLGSEAQAKIVERNISFIFRTDVCIAVCTDVNAETSTVSGPRLCKALTETYVCGF